MERVENTALPIPAETLDGQPDNLSIDGNEVRWKYMTKANWVGLISLATFCIAFLIFVGISIGPVLLSMTPLLLVIAFANARYLKARAGSVCLINSEGIGIEKNGVLIHWAKWQDVKHILLPLSVTPTYRIETGDPKSSFSVPTLTAWTGTESGQVNLAKILRIYGPKTAPIFQDFGDPRSIREFVVFSGAWLAVSTGLLIACFTPILGLTISSFFWPLIFMNFLVTTGLVLLAYSDLSKTTRGRKSKPRFSLISAGNSTLEMDLKEKRIDTAGGAVTYVASEIAQSYDPRMDVILNNVLRVLMIGCALIIACGLLLNPTLRIATPQLFFLSAISALGLVVIVGTIMLTSKAIFNYKSLARSAKDKLVFEGGQVFIEREGERKQVKSLSEAKYSPFSSFTSSTFGRRIMKVELDDETLLFDPANMVQMGDREEMDYYPDLPTD